MLIFVEKWVATHDLLRNSVDLRLRLHWITDNFWCLKHELLSSCLFLFSILKESSIQVTLLHLPLLCLRCAAASLTRPATSVVFQRCRYCGFKHLLVDRLNARFRIGRHKRLLRGKYLPGYHLKLFAFLSCLPMVVLIHTVFHNLLLIWWVTDHERLHLVHFVAHYRMKLWKIALDRIEVAIDRSYAATSTLILELRGCITAKLRWCIWATAILRNT